MYFKLTYRILNFYAISQLSANKSHPNTGKNTITKMPRPRAPTTIVDANDVLDLDVIALENWTLMTLLPALAENLICLQFRWKGSRYSWARSVRHGYFFSGSNRPCSHQIRFLNAYYVFFNCGRF